MVLHSTISAVTNIGLFCTLIKGCKILGRNQIEDQVHVSSSANILANFRIGKEPVVNVDSVVKKGVLKIQL